MQLNKPYTNKQYADLAVYCNDNKCEIVDRGEYLETVAKEPYVPSDEEKAALVRKRRDVMINSIQWRIERYKSQQELEIETTDSSETYMLILRYQQYLRDIPAQEEFPNIELLTFEQWQNND